MAAIFQMTFSNGFFLMKMYEFRFQIHWSLFLRVQLTNDGYIIAAYVLHWALMREDIECCRY